MQNNSLNFIDVWWPDGSNTNAAPEVKVYTGYFALGKAKATSRF